jgi:hypothetical protein
MRVMFFAAQSQGESLKAVNARSPGKIGGQKERFGAAATLPRFFCARARIFSLVFGNRDELFVRRANRLVITVAAAETGPGGEFTRANLVRNFRNDGFCFV